MKTIRKVWVPSFINRSLDNNPTGFAFRENQERALQQIVREKAAQLIEALTALASVRGRFGGPDGSDVAAAIADACGDDEMHVVAKSEYDGVQEDAQALGRFVSELGAAIEGKSGTEPLDVWRDGPRFRRELRAAMLNYAE